MNIKIAEEIHCLVNQFRILAFTVLNVIFTGEREYKLSIYQTLSI